MPAPAREIQAALAFIDQEKAGFIPPYLTDQELAELLAAWHHLHDDPAVKIENNRFIIDHKLYLEPAFARLATHPVVQDAVRKTIGDFQLAGYSVVATPRNGDTPTTPLTTPFHIDHCVYSDVEVTAARDTFVCVWVNFEELKMENGPFALAVGTHKLNIGYDFFKARPGLKVADLHWEHIAGYNTGPAGSTAVYSGKTWHSGTTNCSDMIRKGLNMNFIPRHPLDARRRNPFDVCALSEVNYRRLDQLIGIPNYIIDRIPEMEGAKVTAMA